MHKLSVALILLAGCEGTIVLVGPDAGGGGGPPTIFTDAGAPRGDAGVAPIGVDAGSAPILPDAGPSAPGTTWSAVLITGDDSIRAFDNARERIAELLVTEGVDPAQMIQLSRDAREQVGGVRDTSVETIEQAMMDLEVGDGDGCFVHMTSHGNRTGFFIAGRAYLTPARLDEILDRACGDRPTVVLISACYSGVFVDDLAAPNRVVLTAAHADRTSFGCSAEATYTYWDGCLIDNFHSATTWGALYQQVSKCIEGKEGSQFTPSLPQVSLGDDVRDLPIFYR